MTIDAIIEELNWLADLIETAAEEGRKMYYDIKIPLGGMETVLRALDEAVEICAERRERDELEEYLREKGGGEYGEAEQ